MRVTEINIPTPEETPEYGQVIQTEKERLNENMLNQLLFGLQNEYGVRVDMQVLEEASGNQ